HARLIVPGVAVPAVEIASRRQRAPTLRLAQREARADVLPHDVLHERVQGDVDETLFQRQHVLDHEAVAIGALVAVAVVSAPARRPARTGSRSVRRAYTPGCPRRDWRQPAVRTPRLRDSPGRPPLPTARGRRSSPPPACTGERRTDARAAVLSRPGRARRS